MTKVYILSDFFTFVRHKAVSGKTSKYIPLECMLRVKRQT